MHPPTPPSNAGLKYIPLRTPGGELIHQSGLFVRIRKEAGFLGHHLYEAENTAKNGPIPILVEDTDRPEHLTH